MSKILIKQNKRGTFLDLSKQDITDTKFVDELRGFISENSKFLSGSAVSLILPAGDEGGDSSNLDQIQSELNKRNIALRAGLAAEVQEESQEEETNPSYELPETLYVKANLRAGQMIRYPGNVFIFGDVNPSAEIIASGDIVVWGALRGLAHAGAEGNSQAKIAAMKFDCGQLRISDKITAVSSSKKEKGLHPAIAQIENDSIMIR